MPKYYSNYIGLRLLHFRTHRLFLAINSVTATSSLGLQSVM